MIICVAGDIHGAMNRMYEDVLAFEEALASVPAPCNHTSRDRLRPVGDAQRRFRYDAVP